MAAQNLGRVVGSKIYTGAAIDTNTIQTQLTSQNITPLIYDLYVSTSLVAIFQYQLVENVPTWTYLMSIKGETGTFAISKTYSSVSAMNAGYASDGLPKGALVIIETGNVEDEDNAKLYVKGDKQYNYLTDMSGSQGIQGPKGDKGDTGDKGASGSVFTPSVSSAGVLSWTNNGGLANPTAVNIKGPQGKTGATGEKGDKGDKGDKGETGDTGANGVSATHSWNGTILTVTSASGTSSANLKGDKGDKGDKGETGTDGKTPTLSINANGELVATYA